MRLFSLLPDRCSQAA